ncbi:MAG: hypothetical protein OSA45_15315 [Halioglobus sp.]|nr:hypothetical protein [Halioglobus sp.]
MRALFAIILAIFMLASVWQHFLYLRKRRTSAQDLQRLLHSGATFHILIFFRIRGGEKVVETAARFKQQVMSSGKARLVYAGQAAFSIKSAQLGKRDWDGVLLFEYPSRLDYEESFADPQTCEARELFADSYIHGMRRNCRANMGTPQLLLQRRLRDLLRGKWRIEPLRPSALYRASPDAEIWRSRVNRLRALHEINREGLVVYNLVKTGTVQQRAVDQPYISEMYSRIAALKYGPLHRGRSVALEGGLRFNEVHIIHYPNARYFADLIASESYQSVAGNILIRDTIIVPTAPITVQVLRHA